MENSRSPSDLRAGAPRRWRRVSLVGLATAMAATTIAVVGVTGAASPTKTKFRATADAYVDAGTPSTNYGSARQLRTARQPATVRSFIRFNVAGLDGPVRRATLHLYVLADNPAGAAVHGVEKTVWTEATITA